jgi:hypothetical protein
MRDHPKLSWVNAKTYSQSGASNKNRPGRKEEITTATSMTRKFSETEIAGARQLVADMKAGLNDKREDQEIDRAENEGMGAGARQPE